MYLAPDSRISSAERKTDEGEFAAGSYNSCRHEHGTSYSPEPLAKPPVDSDRSGGCIFRHADNYRIIQRHANTLDYTECSTQRAGPFWLGGTVSIHYSEQRASWVGVGGASAPSGREHRTLGSDHNSGCSILHRRCIWSDQAAQAFSGQFGLRKVRIASPVGLDARHRASRIHRGVLLSGLCHRASPVPHW